MMLDVSLAARVLPLALASGLWDKEFFGFSPMRFGNFRDLLSEEWG
jgi:hypothetical protein